MAVINTTSLPASYNFQVWTDTTFREQIGLVTTASGLPINLTGFSGVLNIRSGPHVDPPLYQMSTTNSGIILTDPTAGIFSLYIPASVTATFDWGGGIYDLLFTDTSGTWFTAGDTFALLEGFFSVRGFDP
jgi:hypothetical protein